MFSGGSGRAQGHATPRILLVDDDRDLLVPLAEQLRHDGFDVTTARDGDEALRRLDTAWPDLLIIDLLMPRMDGLTLAREIKARADLPIIVLSAIDAGDNKADLLDEFAEDYITKPYHYSELRARIQRVLRRVGERVPRKGLDLGPDLSLELHRRQAVVGGEPVQLTPTESRLLFALAANLGQTVTTETLLSRGWAETDDAEPSYVWVTMRRLRQKLEVDPNRPRHLLTVRGIGYRLVPDDGRDLAGQPAGMTPSREPTRARGLSLSFQTRLTLTLLAAAIVPLGVFGLVLIATGTVDPQVGSRLLLFMFAVAVAVGILAGAAIGLDLVRPLRQISAAVERVSAGDLSQPIPIEGSDVLAQLAESHNRLAGDAQRRNRQLGLILAAVESAEPRDGVDALAERAARDAQIAFGFISAELRFVDPDSVEAEERIPGVSLPVRAELRAGDDRMGLILASLPATHTWERADQALFDLYASEIGVAIRNAELFTQVQEKNVQLRQLSEVKDDFLRGVSHNLQTPLTSIKSNAEAIAASDPEARRAADGHLGPGGSADPDGPAAAARQPARIPAAPADRRRPRHRAEDPAGLGCAGRLGPDDGAGR